MSFQHLRPRIQTGTIHQEPDRVYEIVCHHLESGHPETALRTISNCPFGSTNMLLRNAKGVCYLRLGEPALAVALYRSMVLTSYLGLRTDVSLAPKLNFATALFLNGNVNGCLNVLSEIGDESHPSVGVLRASIARWKSELSWRQRLIHALGAQPHHPVTLDFVPGILM